MPTPKEREKPPKKDGLAVSDPNEIIDEVFEQETESEEPVEDE